MKNNSKKTRKIRKLIITCTLSAIVLIVSTYTWFIGMRTVHVNPFEIEIAATEGLYLSLDGATWAYDLDVMTAAQYTNNTNQISNVELVPMSSVGDIDPTSATLKMFEKASLTTSPGGYRLLASRVNNYTSSEVGEGASKKTVYKEQNGYIAFDLFIKNLSGNEYYTANQPLNEEAIYLNFDSKVEVKSTGADGQELTGIENSVRVAFTQIGRVSATTTDVATITGLTCNLDTAEGATKGKPIYTEATGVTGICRDAQIWEPNDTKHVQNALNWYKESCITRTGAETHKPASYNVTKYAEDGSVETAAQYCYNYTDSDESTKNTQEYLTSTGGTIPTYAISKTIEIGDNVDVYDGAVLNTYTSNTMTYSAYNTANKVGKLVEFPYFTDTMKNKLGMDRPQFMTLAPNSITKVRVYIWLEGQDIDNYDFAQLGKTISINFGFTKERFLDTDVDYDSENSPMTREDFDKVVSSEVATQIPTTKELAE